MLIWANSLHHWFYRWLLWVNNLRHWYRWFRRKYSSSWSLFLSNPSIIYQLFKILKSIFKSLKILKKCSDPSVECDILSVYLVQDAILIYSFISSWIYSVKVIPLKYYSAILSISSYLFSDMYLFCHSYIAYVSIPTCIYSVIVILRMYLFRHVSIPT